MYKADSFSKDKKRKDIDVHYAQTRQIGQYINRIYMLKCVGEEGFTWYTLQELKEEFYYYWHLVCILF